MKRVLIHMPSEMRTDVQELARSLALSSSSFIRLAIAIAVQAMRSDREALFNLNTKQGNENGG